MSPPSSLLVVVAVSGQTLAVPAAAIGELVHEPALVQPPQMPGAVAGLFSLRGEVVPVLRPEIVLNLPPPAPGPFRVLLVFQRNPAPRWALLVERAVAVLTGALAPVPPGHSLGDCVMALMSGTEPPLPVLAPDRLLRRSEAKSLAELTERVQHRWGEFRLGDA